MPKFETEQDLAEERRIADYLENKWGVTLVKRPDPLIDFDVFIGDQRVALIEVKCRKGYAAQEIEPIFLSVQHKYRNGMKLGKRYGVACHVVWEFSDGIYIVNMLDINENSCDIQKTGRRDRHGAGASDIEECWLIPLGLMKRIDSE